MTKNREGLVALARMTAFAGGLNPVLVCAIVERESTWDTWSERYEDGFYRDYIVPLNLKSPTEARARAFSRGLMQLMGQSARERGFTESLSKLFDPDVCLEWGCRHLAFKLQHANGDVKLALERWNGGGNPNYADEVFAMMEHYK